MKFKLIVLSGVVMGVVTVVAMRDQKREEDDRHTPVARKLEPMTRPVAVHNSLDIDGILTEHSPEAIKSRNATIGYLQKEKSFGDLRVIGNVGELTVLNDFLEADKQSRELCVAIALAWCIDHNPACNVLVLRDSTGKRVGKLEGLDGGLKLATCAV